MGGLLSARPPIFLELQTDQTLDQTDTEANKGNHNEHQQQRLTGDHVDKGSNPLNGFGYKQSNLRQNFSHNALPPGLQTDQTLDQTDTQTDERNDNEHQDQRVGSDHADEVTDPGNGSGNQGRNGIENSSNSDSSNLSKNLLSKK